MFLMKPFITTPSRMANQTNRGHSDSNLMTWIEETPAGGVPARILKARENNGPNDRQATPICVDLNQAIAVDPVGMDG
jgi:hypothetical protein